MSGGFGDYAIAAKARDAFTRIAETTVERLRPRIQYAEVISIDRVNRRATVTFPGEATVVTVGMGAVQPSAAGQIVRIDGPVGDRFISDVMGTPFNHTHTHPLEPTVFEFSSVGSGVATTLTAGTSDVPNYPGGLTFTKTRADTHLLMQISASCYAGGAAAWCQWGVALGGTDYMAIGNHYFNAGGDHRYWSSAVRLIGIAAGTYSVKGRWKWGAGTLYFDNNDLFSMILQEVVPV